MKKTIGRKSKSVLAAILSAMILLSANTFALTASAAETEAVCKVDVSELTVTENGETTAMTVFAEEDFDSFYAQWKAGALPKVYLTKFVFDGVGMVSKHSIDDDTGEVSVKLISTNVINVNTTGGVSFTGKAKNTMIAVDTNDVTENIDLILDGADITSSKNTPVVMVSNRDITYDACKVTIVTKVGTENFLTGGKLKKTSTMDKDSLSGTYAELSDYYGVYSSDEISQLLFANNQADAEDIADGDPVTFYKYGGAIGTDTDLYFNGQGTLTITGAKDEGVETKGDLVFEGGTGDYIIYANDDGLNASTNGTDISINVSSMYVEVLDGEDIEGDGIDSNGTLHIEGGLIVSKASPNTQDAGLDSDRGTYINGGTVVATGNMADEISSESKQNYMYLNFAQKQSADTLVCVTDSGNNPVIAYNSDRTFTNIVFSSPELENVTYYVYENGTITGESLYNLYTDIKTYEGGTQQCYTMAGGQGGPGGMGGPGGRPGGQQGGEPGEMPSMPIGERPSMPDGEQGGFGRQGGPGGQRGGEQGEMPSMPEGEQPGGQPGGQGAELTGTGSVEFTLSDTQHIFSGVQEYKGGSEPSEVKYGDVNGDGEVNIVDRMYLTRYLASWDGYSEIDADTADLNGDGTVNLADRIILTRHLANWEGYETLPYKS